MSIKSHSVHTIAGKDAILFLKTRNDGNPDRNDIIQRAKEYKFDFPEEDFEAVAGQYRTDFACRIKTTVDDVYYMCSCVTHVYNVLVREKDGEMYIVQKKRDTNRYFLKPLPVETAHGPVSIDTGTANGRPYMFDRAHTRNIEKWTKFCDMVRKTKVDELLEQENAARKFFDTASEALGNSLHVLQQTGPNVTKFCFDYGQLRFTYEEEDGKWYRRYEINPAAVPTDEQLFGIQKDWVDLGLPSGRLWASKNEPGYHQFYEAVKTYGDQLPPIEAWNELFQYCSRKWDADRKGYILTGPNGNRIFLPAKGMNEWNSNTKKLIPDGIYAVGSVGYYWSSTTTRLVYFDNDIVHLILSLNHANGLSIRLCKPKD